MIHSEIEVSGFLLMICGLLFISGCAEKYNPNFHNCTYWYCVYNGEDMQVQDCNGSYINISRNHFQPNFCENSLADENLISASCSEWIDKTKIKVRYDY
jgi:hypothetical protein